MNKIYHFANILKEVKVLLLLLLLPGFLYSQPTPSVGGVYNANNKVLWLKAEDITPEDGNLVALWPDASGKNNHAVAAGNNRPDYLSSSSIFNNRPAVRFNSGVNQHMLQIPDNENLDGMQELTVIAVLRNSNPPSDGQIQEIISKKGNTATRSWRLFLGRSGSNHQLGLRLNSGTGTGAMQQTYVYYNQAMVHTGIFSGIENYRAIFSNGDRRSGPQNFQHSSVNRNVGTRVTIGNILAGGSNWFRGEIAEIIVLRDALNQAQRLIVENILAFKYNFPLDPSSFNRYFLNNFHSISHNYDIIGIGGLDVTGFGYQKHSASMGSGGALYLSEVANSFDDHNEFVFAAHNGVAHNTTTLDLPADPDLENRWTRVWRIERTIPQGIGGGTAIRVGFDFNEAGITPDAESLYVLLFKENATGTFTRLPISSAPSGSRVSFSVPDVHLKTGYYTIAKSSATVKTWSTVQSGPWESPATWGLATGYPGEDEINDRADNIEINNTHLVTITDPAASYTHGDLRIKAGGVLAINETRGHAFNTIRGEGRMIITGDYFPEGDAANFTASNGGTVVFNGSGSFDFITNRKFNNVEIDLASTSDQISLLANYTLNGSLIVKRGILQINDSSPVNRTLWVSGNVNIFTTGQLLTGDGNARHRFTIRGNFVNNGTARFSNLLAPLYNMPADNGMVDVVFNRQMGDQVIQANGITEFYRMEIAKGLTDSLFIRSNNPDRFFLMGQNNFDQTDGHWAPNLPNNNALGLLSGIVVLEQNVRIPKLKSKHESGYAGHYLIDQDAQIILRGGFIDVPVEVTSLGVFGALIVDGGHLNVMAYDGVTLRQSGRFEIYDGKADMRVFRTSEASGVHRGSYVQTGGTVTVSNDYNGGNANYYRFTLPYPTNVFTMTGGDLTITYPRTPGDASSASLHGGILIASLPENQHVTGGTVNAVLDNHRSFIINSSAPFYNLNLLRTSSTEGIRFLVAPYPGGVPDAGTSNPPPPSEAFLLRVLNKLTIQGGTRPVTLDLNGYGAIFEGDVLLEQGAQILGENSSITFSGVNNSTFETQDPTYTLSIGSLTVNKTANSDTLFVKRTNLNDNSEIIRVNSLLSARMGILQYGSYQLSLKGDLELDAPIGSVIATGKLVLNGDDLQHITVTNPASASFIGHLEIENDKGVKLNDNSIRAIHTLTLTNGSFDINNHGLTIENNIEGNGFGPSKMIVTAGGHPNKGLTRLLKNDGNLHFPIGTNANENPRYTPLSATFSDVAEDVYISVTPVDNELSTLDGSDPDEALTYYWKVRHSEVASLPKVTEYVFSYADSDLPPILPTPFVPGKVIGVQRHYEAEANFDNINKTLTIDGAGSGFTLEQGEYTAAKVDKFYGMVRVFYSRGNTDPMNPADWNEHDTWSLDSHLGISSGQLPGPGDLVHIGLVADQPHAVIINNNVNVAGLEFKGENENLPALIIGDSDIAVNLGIVSGSGDLVKNLGTHQANLSGDFDAFVETENSVFTYKAITLTGDYIIQAGFDKYPNLRIEGINSGTAKIRLPINNIEVSGNMIIANFARAILSDNGSNGNVTVRKNLILGDGGEDVLLLFPESGSSKTLHVAGNIYLRGSIHSGIKTEGPSSGNINHLLMVEGNILHDNGDLDFYNGDEVSTRISLKLIGDNDAFYERDGGTTPDFYRIILDKGQDIQTQFTFFGNFNLSASSGSIQKPLQLISGKLILAGPGTDINLTTGGSDFEIPAKAGLLLKDNAVARANADDVGITLRGFLRIEENASLLMAGPSSKAHIQYGSSGNARLEISGNALLEVASFIRGFLENDNGVLKYMQDGGNVIVGKNILPSTISTLPRPAVFEIFNPGSSFHFTGGNLYVVRGHVVEPGNHRETIYLHPAQVIVNPNATLNLGHPSITTDLRPVTVSSSAVLPSVQVWLGGTVEAELKTNITVLGNISINAGKILNANQAGLQITLSGDLINNGTFLMNNGTLIMNGEDQLIKGGTQITLNNLVVNAVQEVALERNITILGNLQLLNGFISDLGHSIFLNGNVNNQSGHQSSENTGGLIFSGVGGTQLVSGSGSFGRFIVQNTDGVMLANSININDALILDFGILNIGNHLLAMGPDAVLSPGLISDFNANRMIQLSGDINAQGMRWSISEPGQYNFPIGVANKFTPAWIESSTLQNNAHIQLAPINTKHPSIVSNPNLNYYWAVNSTGLSGFVGDVYFRYNEADAQGNQSEYISAKLFNAAWSRLSINEVDEVLNNILFPYPDAVNNISGDYTAGQDIPEVVLSFRTIADGDWSDKGIWENITSGYDPDDVPESGPIGQILEVSNGHVVNTGTARKIAYRTAINGTLMVKNSAPPHYLGEVTGSGQLVIDFPSLPNGNYQNFLSNGTLEYTGVTDYTIDPARFPESGGIKFLNNLIFSGSGERIMPSGLLVLHGNLELKDNVFVDFAYNDLSIQLRGNLSKEENSVLFSGNGVETSSITFNGSALQTIGGNFSGQSKLNNILVNNLAGVTIDGLVELRNRLDFENGRVFTSLINTLRLLNNAVVNGANNNRFINGPLQKQGNTRFEFPVGHNNRMGRIAFRPVGVAWDSQTIIQAGYYNQTPPNNENGLDPLDRVSLVEYWSLTLPTPGVSIGGQVELFIEDPSFSGIPFPQQVLIGWYNATQTRWESQGGTPHGTSPEYIRSENIDLSQKSGLFSFGADGNSDNPLPIELVSFTAEPVNQTVLLQWTTASEINNDYFTLERSIDGIKFEVIGFVSGAGNSNTFNSYRFIDNEPFEGISYYRLKQTDFDGTFKYFDMVAVELLKPENIVLKLFPNPVQNGLLNISLDGFSANDSFVITVTDVYGRIAVHDHLYTDYSGSARHTLNNLNQLTPGIYFVSIHNNKTKITERIIVR